MFTRGVRLAVCASIVCAGVWLVQFDLLRAQAQGRGAGASAAAAAAPRRISVQITQLIPGEAATFRSLVQKEVIPAEKKGGLAWRQTYTGTPLGEQFIYVTIRPVESLANFDKPNSLVRGLGADAAAKLNDRLAQTIASRRTMIQTFAPALSIESGAIEPASLIVVEDVQIQLDQLQPFTQFMTTQQLPALKKLGVKDYWVFATTWGGPAGQRTIVEPIPNFAALETITGPPNRFAKAIGADAAAKLTADRSALVQRQERSVMRLVPEMSFTTTPPPQRTSK